jgi:hypothetical protein
MNDVREFHHLSDDDVLDFVHGLGGPAARARWSHHVAACPSCGAACVDQERTLARARAEWPLVRAGLKEFEATQERAASRSRGFVATAVVAAAAAAILLVPLSGTRPTIPLQPMPEDLEFTSLRDPGAATVGPDLARGFRAYARREFVSAAAILRRSRAEGAAQDLRLLYLGSALAFSGKSAEAVRVLSPLDPERIPDPWRSELAWTLFSARIAAGERVRIDSILPTLAAMSASDSSRAAAVRLRLGTAASTRTR